MEEEGPGRLDNQWFGSEHIQCCSLDLIIKTYQVKTWVFTQT